MKTILFLSLFLVIAYSSKAQPLNYEWNQLYGGALNYSGSTNNIDESGNIYMVAGVYDKATQNSANETTGLFITKLKPSGEVLWTKTITEINFGGTISKYKDGFLYISYSKNVDGIFECITIKLNTSGEIIWKKSFAGGFSTPTTIEIDKNNDVYIAGLISNAPVDFDPDNGTYFLTNITHYLNASFLAKLSSDGIFKWAKVPHVNGKIGDLVFDKNNDLYLTGYNEINSNKHDIILEKYNSNGNILWQKIFGGAVDDEGNAILINNTGTYIYITGSFYLTTDLDPSFNNFNLTSAGSLDCFIAKYDIDGNFVWADRIGGDSNETPTALKTDSKGNIYLLADFASSTIVFKNYGRGKFNPSYDALLIKFNQYDNLAFILNYGGPKNDYTTSMSIDQEENIYISGTFEGTADFDPNLNKELKLTSSLDGTGKDTYLLKLNQKDIVTSLTNNQNNNTIIYPNPAENIIHINTDKAIQPYSISTLDGILIKKGVSENSSINISDMNKGMYILNIDDNFYKFCIQK